MAQKCDRDSLKQPAALRIQEGQEVLLQEALDQDAGLKLPVRG
jgi:hypothetical protein